MGASEIEKSHIEFKGYPPFKWCFILFVGIDPSEKKLEMTGDILEIFHDINPWCFIYVHLPRNSMDVPVGCRELQLASGSKPTVTTSEQQLVGGWATYPSEKWWSESQLGWFSISNWMESHKSHVPNHQPGKMTGIHRVHPARRWFFVADWREKPWHGQVFTC